MEPLYQSAAAQYETQGNYSWSQARKALEQGRKQEKHRLQKQKQEIQEQVKRRDSIHSQLINEIESEILNQKEELPPENSRKIKEILDIRDSLENLYQEKREETVDHWEDRQRLLKEKREIEKEIRELDETQLDQLMQ